MTSLIFYERPVALNPERHGKTKLALTGDFSFSRATNSVLITATELADASASFPVLFVGTPAEGFGLAAMVGLKDRDNLFVNDDGKWDAESYLPAFVRRYPFVLAEGGPVADELTVCVDEAFAGLNTEHGEALFDDKGAPTPMLQGAVDFLRLFHDEMLRTHAFAQRVAALDVLVPKNVEVEHAGAKQVVEGVYIVDTERLHALDDATLARLVRSGDMQLIDAHLMSLKMIPRLISRLERRGSATAQ
ncbi:MAG: SapC family protein [Massilia sp.]